MGATPQAEGLVRARGPACFHTLAPALQGSLPFQGSLAGRPQGKPGEPIGGGGGGLGRLRRLDDESPAPESEHVAATTNRQIAMLNKGPTTLGN